MKWLRNLFARPLPHPIAVTFYEGSEWHRFPLDRQTIRDQFGGRYSVRVHSIMFDDGNCWDAVNGWRDDRSAAGLYGVTVEQYRKDRLRDCIRNSHGHELK